MKIYSINPFSYHNLTPTPSFESRGKPIDLKYIVEKRSNLLPPRVLNEAQIILKSGRNVPSLKELHNKIYSCLLSPDMTLDKAKEIFPEFKGIAESVTFERESVFKTRFEEKTKGVNFPLKMLQELWGNLKLKDDLAQEMGFKSRSSIDWALNKIGFVYFPTNYRTLIKASDEEENKEIAQKTRAYNQLHPDLMYAKNKHAAQFCKTDEYRTAQRERMIERDKINPERRKKIADFDRRTWELCPEIKKAMSLFAQNESPYARGILKKKITGCELSEAEQRINKAYFKRFWAAHPEMRSILTAAKAQVRAEMKTEKM